jgi:hypothetical protein
MSTKDKKDEEDKVRKVITGILKKAEEPLETIEIQKIATQEIGNDVTRTILLYRLNNLRGEGQIKGKQIGSGKGTWIWWRGDLMGSQP